MSAKAYRLYTAQAHTASTLPPHGHLVHFEFHEESQSFRSEVVDEATAKACHGEAGYTKLVDTEAEPVDWTPKTAEQLVEAADEPLKGDQSALNAFIESQGGDAPIEVEKTSDSGDGDDSGDDDKQIDDESPATVIAALAALSAQQLKGKLETFGVTPGNRNKKQLITALLAEQGYKFDADGNEV